MDIISQNDILEFDNFELNENNLKYILPDGRKVDVILESCILRLQEINSEDNFRRNLVFLYKSENLANRRFLQRIYFIENLISKLLNNQKGIITNITKDKTVKFFITENTKFFKNNQSYEPIRCDIKSLYKNALCKCLIKLSPLEKENENYFYKLELLELIIS